MLLTSFPPVLPASKRICDRPIDYFRTWWNSPVRTVTRATYYDDFLMVDDRWLRNAHGLGFQSRTATLLAAPRAMIRRRQLQPVVVALLIAGYYPPRRTVSRSVGRASREINRLALR